MTTFAERQHAADLHELETKRLLEERGWTCDRFGQALLSDRVRDLLRTTRSALRWLPDLIAARRGQVLLVDSKDAQRLDTPNWSIEIAAYDAGSLIQQTFGHPLLYVWHDFTANFHDELSIETSFETRSFTSGSGTPFHLVRKSSTRSLDDVLSDASAA